jgi:hypothetical protein
MGWVRKTRFAFYPMIPYLGHVGDVCVLFVWEMGFVTRG